MNATQTYLLNKKRELSGLNFLREIKETSKKCKSETLNSVSTQGPLYHFTSNHINGLKRFFWSVPWESLKFRDPLGQGVQEVKTIFTTTLNVTSVLILFWMHSGVLQRQVPGGLEVKASASNEGDSGLIPGSGRSHGEENGNPLQYSCLENPQLLYRGAWRA